MQAVYPHMRDQGWGRIVNFASSMGITGGKGFGAYNASNRPGRPLGQAADETAVDPVLHTRKSPTGRGQALRHLQLSTVRGEKLPEYGNPARPPP